jgi:5'-nucleotidase
LSPVIHRIATTTTIARRAPVTRPFRPRRLLGLAAAGVGLALGVTATTGPVAADDGPSAARTDPVRVQILGLNDFHGNLEPPAGSSGRIEGVDAGGAEYLATHVAQLEATNPKNTIVVSAGDLIGASPLLSALFHDEPTIEAMNHLGLDLNAVGNHEFDEGTAELLRMQRGGCHPVDGCLDGDGFAGADFQFLAANVVSEGRGKTLFPPFAIEKFEANIQVAFIGMTLEGTPTIVTPEGVEGFDFLDEADTANALVPKLKSQGVENIVVLLHEGGVPTGGYTHAAYNCVINDIPVTSAASFGRLITDMDLTIDRQTKEITSITANNGIVTRTVPKDGFITSLISRYKAISDPLAKRVIGSITADITRAATPAGESALGDVIADSQLRATTPPELGGAVAAFMNPGGIRTDLLFAASGAEGDGNVTYEEAFTVQPFGNSLVTMTLTGAQIETMLEQQFCGINASLNRVLQPSAGFTYTWNGAAIGAADCATANAVDPATIAIGGVPVDPAGTYRITVNSFLATGGDGFAVLNNGTDRLGGAVDLDALEAYFVASPNGVAPGPRDRITRVN